MMTTVFLQPAGRGKDSVEQYQEIQKISSKGSVSICGVTLGKKNRTKAKWKKMSDGDLVLFSSKN